MRRQLGMAPEKVLSNIATYGNTTSVTLPILYHELRAAGRVDPGNLVCFTAFGAGSHWGALLYREPEPQGGASLNRSSFISSGTTPAGAPDSAPRALEQARNESAADVPGGPGDQDPHSC